jgi:hypothetical protein
MVMLVLRRKAGFTSRLGAAIFALTPYPLSAAIQPISERSLAERGGNPLEEDGGLRPHPLQMASPPAGSGIS